MNIDNNMEECYNSYLKADKDSFDRWLILDSSIIARWTPYTKEEFINKCKTNPEFSENWGLKIEERDLSREERYNLMSSKTGHSEANIALRKKINNFEGNIPRVSYHEEWLDSFKIPTKLITITYNNETLEIYE